MLNYLGKDPNSNKADDYTGPATDLLLKLRPNIRYFHSSQYINDRLTAISAWQLAGQGTSGRRLTVRKRRKTA